MAVENTCPDCGARQSADPLGGLCPRCLLGLGLEFSEESEGRGGTGRSSGGSSGGEHGFILNPDGAAAAATAAVSGLLSTLDGAVGPVPRVLLRDGPAEESRPVRIMSAEMPPLTGGVGRYQLLGELARGGIGAVLKGRDVDLGRDLAVKVLLEKHRAHPEMIRRFIEEAQIGGQLQHPGIVPVHELGRFPDGRLYIAMKLVRGRTLAALLEARKAPVENRPQLLSIFEQVCQTMAYAHSRGVIHRDLKPSNVMVGNFGEVQVMDWGLAKVLDQGGIADEEKAMRSHDEANAVRTLRTGSEADESRAGSVIGTPPYMAPEQARGALDTLDERADVFGLGSILCEILTGRPAFTGSTARELYRKARQAELGDALARLEGCGADGELLALARSCLAAAAKDRPRDAGMVLAGLTVYLTGVEERLREAGLARAKAEARAAEERKRRILTVALAASTLAIAVLVGGGWSWWVRERALRREATALAVGQALDAAFKKRDQARSEPGDVPPSWIEAVEAARRAEALLGRGEENPDLRGRVRAALDSIVHERDQARAAAKDRGMVERLIQIHDDLGVHFDFEKTDAEYAAAFHDYGVDVDALEPAAAGARLAASPAAVELANGLDQWAFLRRGPSLQNLAGARRLIEVAKAADPDPWRNQLRATLDTIAADRNKALGALMRLADTADVDSLPEASVTRLAFALSFFGNRRTAINLLKRIQQTHPNDFWINCDLGRDLMWEGEPAEAGRFYSAAVAIRPQSGFALHGLGAALHGGGRLEDAAATFRKVIRLRPANPSAHTALGAVLLDLGETARAEREFDEAKRLDPTNWRVYSEIASVRSDRGDWEAAIRELREAARREPRTAIAQNVLGGALLQCGRLDDATAAFREAVRIDPGSRLSAGNLGRALLAGGEFDAALEVLRQGRHGSSETDRRSPSDALVREAERMIALDARLPGLLKGAYRPASPAEAVEFARLCQSRQQFAAAARLWDEAFTARPSLADDPGREHRYRAACASALASQGRGRDDPRPDDASRRRLRRQALDWLAADLSAAGGRLKSHNHANRERAALSRRLGRWRVAPALSGLRDPAVLATLPDPERRAWQAFWSEVEALHARVRRDVGAPYLTRPF